MCILIANVLGFSSAYLIQNKVHNLYKNSVTWVKYLNYTAFIFIGIGLVKLFNELLRVVILQEQVRVGEIVSSITIFILIIPTFIFLIAFVAILLTSDNKTTSKNKENTTNKVWNCKYTEEQLWQIVSDEMKNGIRVDALWTRVFAESDGEINKANANYLKYRYEQVKKENLIETDKPNVLIEKVHQINTKNEAKSDFYYLFIAVLFLIGAWFLINEIFFPFNPNNSKGWADQNTNVKTYGSFLTDNSPYGTRLCRDSDGNIHRLIPPWALSDNVVLPPIDPICFRNSKKKLD